MITIQCKVCTDVIGKKTGDVVEKIEKNYFRNERDIYICTDCYYSFGMQQEVDSHA